MAQYLKVSPVTDNQLTELSKKRKAEHAVSRSKQDIAAEAVAALHKKECK